MNIRIFDKQKAFVPKETVSYRNNENGEIETVRIKSVPQADPKRVAKDFICANRIRGNVIPYYDGVEIDIQSDVSDFIEKLEANGFNYEADGLTLKEFADELGASEGDLMALANKSLPWAMRLKKRSIIDQSAADTIREAYRASKRQRGAHFPGR